MSTDNSQAEIGEKTKGNRKKRIERSGVVTFLDILGWKGIYNREENPILLLQSLITGLEGQIEKNWRGRDDIEIFVRSISDTIVIHCKASEGILNEAIDAHGKLCAFAIAQSIVKRIPLRGATAYGEFQAEHDNYVGKAIDEAAAWHEMGDWIGVHMTPSASYAVDVSELKNWKDYKPPLKNGLSNNTPCVCWLSDWKNANPKENPLRVLKESFRKMGPILPEFSAKFENTLLYAEKMHEIACKEEVPCPSS